jgi:hypothetical protein
MLDCKMSVKPGDAVRRVASHNGESGHVNDPSVFSRDDGGLLFSFRFVGESARHLPMDSSRTAYRRIKNRERPFPVGEEAAGSPIGGCHEGG